MNNFARPGLGATELPPVNSDDNGKVLGVSDGAWAKVAASGGSDLPDDPGTDGIYTLQNTVSSGTGTLSWESGGSGGGVLVVNATWGDTAATLDKTWQEIKDGGFGVVVSQMGDNEVAYHPIIGVLSALGQYKVRVIYDGENGLEIILFTVNSASGYPAYQYE